MMASARGRRDYPGELAFQCQALGLPEPVRELRFHPTRRWRFDLAWQHYRLAVEVDGAIWVQGRHSRGGGVTNDCVKYAAAMLRGWRVLRVVPGQVVTGQAVSWIEALLRDTIIWTTVAPDAAAPTPHQRTVQVLDVGKPHAVGMRRPK